MSLGVSILNDSGYQIIDENYIQYEVIAEGVIPYNASTAAPYGIEYPIPVVEGRLLLIYETTPNFVRVEVRESTFVANANTYPSPGGTLYYKVIAPIQTASPDQYGMRIRNANNKIVYDTGKKYIGVGAIVTDTRVATHDSSQYYFSPLTQTVTLPTNSGGYWYVADSNCQIVGGYLSGGTEFVFTYTIFKTSSSGITFSGIDSYNDMTPGWIAEYPLYPGSGDLAAANGRTTKQLVFTL